MKNTLNHRFSHIYFKITVMLTNNDRIPEYIHSYLYFRKLGLDTININYFSLKTLYNEGVRNF